MRSFAYFLTILAFMWVVSLCAGHAQQGYTAEAEQKGKHVEEKIFDPVCEMRVKKEDAKIAEFKAKMYYFCSYDCRDKFLKDPEKFACPCRTQIHLECACEHCEGEAARCKCPQAEEISPQLKGEKVFDPVCGTRVEREKAVRYVYRDSVYYFCSIDCRKAFINDPNQFACLCSTEHANCVCEHCERQVARCDCKESEEAKRLQREKRPNPGEDPGP